MSTTKPFVPTTTELRRLLPQQRRHRCVPWVTHEYNDEELLREVKMQNPREPWAQIRRIYNNKVPLRQRSLDALYTKWKDMKRLDTSLQTSHISENVSL